MGAKRRVARMVLMRSRARHEAWLAGVPGPVLRLEGDRPVGQQLARLEAAVEAGLDTGNRPLASWPDFDRRGPAR